MVCCCYDGPQWFLPLGIQCPCAISSPWVWSGLIDLLLMDRVWQMWRPWLHSWMHSCIAVLGEASCHGARQSHAKAHRSEFRRGYCEASHQHRSWAWKQICSIPTPVCPWDNRSHACHLIAAMVVTLSQPCERPEQGPPNQASPRSQTHRNSEIINACCLQSLRFGIICYSTTEYKYIKNCPPSHHIYHKPLEMFGIYVASWHYLMILFVHRVSCKRISPGEYYYL